jgi:hypothetical protein
MGEIEGPPPSKPFVSRPMNTAITTIYTITDDWLKSRRHKESAQCTVSDAEVMTVAITAARFFHGNYAKT